MAVCRLPALFQTLWRTFFAASTRQPDPVPLPVTETERISRYVLDKGHFTLGRVKFRAFLPPNNNTPDGVALSVGRTEDLTEIAVWEWGDENVAASTGRIILARGDFTLADLRDVSDDGTTLTVVPDEPPPRHADVIGWPPVDQKGARTSLAQQLAAKAQVVV